MNIFTEDDIERVNKINSFVNTAKNVTEINTYTLAIVKVVFNYMLKTKAISDSMSEPERLNVVNAEIDSLCENITLDRAKVKSYFGTKLDHHFKGPEMPMYQATKLSDLSADYGTVDKDLDVSIIFLNLTLLMHKKD